MSKAIVVGGALVVAAVSVALVGARDAGAQPHGSAPVTIVGPLPIPVTGTVTVNGVPSEVTIGNPETAPIPIRDVDAALREPVQFRGVPTFFSGGNGSVTLVTVPADKMLVIEHVSGIVNENSASGLTSCALGTTQFGDPVDWLLCEPMGSNALNHFYVANSSTKYYAAPGSTVSFATSTIALDGEGFVAAFASGYYLPAP